MALTRRRAALLGAAAVAPLILAESRLAGAHERPEYRHPRAIVPYVGDAPPEIDGIVGQDEYRAFATISGMVTWGGPGGGLRQGRVVRGSRGMPTALLVRGACRARSRKTMTPFTLSTRKRTAGVTLVARPPANSHFTPAFRQARR